jgi:hypothetical protein
MGALNQIAKVALPKLVEVALAGKSTQGRKKAQRFVNKRMKKGNDKKVT